MRGALAECPLNRKCNVDGHIGDTCRIDNAPLHVHAVRSSLASYSTAGTVRGLGQ